jgi:CRISPR-associated protein Csb2
MDTQALIISVRLLDGRYYGAGDWPPSPFRLFQALVSAAHLGRAASDGDSAALCWLEGLPPPIIAAPKAKLSRTTTSYVPRNGADAFGGNLARAAQARDAKHFQPWLFDAGVPFLYVWRFWSEDAARAAGVVALAERLYQLGRGVDMAFALAETVAAADAERRLGEHPGVVYRLTVDGSAHPLRCPLAGASLDSLRRRHAEQLARLRGKKFRLASPPVFRTLGYDAPPRRFLYELRRADGKPGFAAWPFERAAALAERVRDLAAARLRPHLAPAVERYLMGREATEADKPLRVRLVPLPSIGHEHTQRDIRRVLVEVPVDCPLAAADVAWAFAGLKLGVDPATGELVRAEDAVLVPSDDLAMLGHYGIGGKDGGARVWRTVTPAALSVARTRGERCGGTRADAMAAAAHAARQALRHAGWTGRAEVRRIQREPFEAKGALAGDFKHGRFAAGGLYHLEIAFDEPVRGPLLVGNGRFVGLGLLRPVEAATPDVFSLPLVGNHRPAVADRAAFLEAARRTLMGRARQMDGGPGRLFSGHEADGAAARSGRHEHVFLAAEDGDGDGRLDRLLIAAPWRVDRNAPAGARAREAFGRVAGGLAWVRAGALGVIELGGAVEPDAADALCGTALVWESVTAYVPTRYPKGRDGDVAVCVAADVGRECQRRGLPSPSGVEVLRVEAGPRGGVRAWVRLGFAVGVAGPVLLGRDSHAGGGLFRAVGG